MDGFQETDGRFTGEGRTVYRWQTNGLKVTAGRTDYSCGGWFSPWHTGQLDGDIKSQRILWCGILVVGYLTWWDPSLPSALIIWLQLRTYVTRRVERKLSPVIVRKVYLAQCSRPFLLIRPFTTSSVRKRLRDRLCYLREPRCFVIGRLESPSKQQLIHSKGVQGLCFFFILFIAFSSKFFFFILCNFYILYYVRFSW